MIELTSRTPMQTVAIGIAIARCARAGDVIALEGELGAGKTQLVRGLAAGMGLDPAGVSSPTFVLMHEYEPEDPAAGLVLVHIDAYRLKGPGDLAALGWGDELLEQAVVAVEWAPRVRTGLGDDCLDVRLQHAEDHRRVTLWPGGSWRDREPQLREALRMKFHEDQP